MANFKGILAQKNAHVMSFRSESAENDKYKVFQYTSSQNYLRQKNYLNERFVAFGNRIYDVCMPQVLIVLFIRVIVTGILVNCSN